MEIGMSIVELAVFGVTALLVVVVAVVARRGQPHLQPRDAGDARRAETATPRARLQPSTRRVTHGQE